MIHVLKSMVKLCKYKFMSLQTKQFTIEVSYC